MADAFAGRCALRVLLVENSTRRHTYGCPDAIAKTSAESRIERTRRSPGLRLRYVWINTSYQQVKNLSAFVLLRRHRNRVADGVGKRLHHRVHVDQNPLIHDLPGSVDDQHAVSLLEGMVLHRGDDFAARHERPGLSVGI